ncbi:hypothetical protein HK098_004572 [Nowakowskiella sp. JEL0407]|nr:hypothetical protein HK098_004572 [Nowakowskiella sp. JEL0407]
MDGISTLSDTEIEKWLISNKGHRGKALSALSESLTWRKSLNIPNLLSTDFSEFEATRMLQFSGKAVDGTPVLILNGAQRKIPKDFKERDKEIKFFFYVLEKARVDGIFKDQLIVIIDRTNMSRAQQSDAASIPPTIIPLLQKHYPERLKSMYIFPNSTMFWMAWQMIVLLIDSNTVKKISLKDNANCLVALIDKEMLPEKYGGSRKEINVSSQIIKSNSIDLMSSSTTSPASSINVSGTTPTVPDSANQKLIGSPTTVVEAISGVIGASVVYSSGIFGGLLGGNVKGTNESEQKQVVVEEIWCAPDDLEN